MGFLTKRADMIKSIKVEQIIDRNYSSVSILEDMQEIAGWLKGCRYLAIVDEEPKTVGVVTRSDVVNYPERQVIDCDFLKPQLAIEATILEAFILMKKVDAEFLPVYKQDTFIGVISLFTITEKLFEMVCDTQL